MTHGFSEDLREQEHHLLKEINLKEQLEDLLWKQKSKHRWLKEGERNTKFFHKATIHHCQGNRMTRLKTKEGHIAETQEELEITLNSYFAKLLEEPNWDRDAS